MKEKRPDIELIVLLLLIICGMGLGITFYLRGDRNLSAVLFSISLASILYRFLGGIGQENSLGMGAIKMSGSAAVLAGFIYFLNGILGGSDLMHLVEPHDNWIPINPKTGSVVEVVIADSIRVPGNSAYVGLRKQNRLRLEQSDAFWYVVHENSGDTIGKINHLPTITEVSSFNFQSLVEDDYFTFALTPFMANQTSRKNQNVPEDLFFEVKVVNCRCEIWQDDKKIIDQSMSAGGGEVHFLESPEDGKLYMVFLLSADCERKVSEEMEAVFSVVRFVTGRK